ncbi:MAG: filamentous hemagglutinin N-terminal domain-containing protein [Symploca sp. SIO1C2]|nr:filamentous hemagglutinin N-terminal domain-containing protein [Symploca sp. SIO1C2]
MFNKLWYKLLRLASWLTIFVVFPFNQHRVLAQITPDTTLGPESSRVTPNVEVRGGLADLIEGGAERNANLFHSFGQFNIQELQRVYFANPVGIENILTRVTGANPSHIFGTLGVDGGASLFLLNPHGIMFGANGQLDVEGSFVASTANAFTFEDDSVFSAVNPGNSSVLTISVPLGLQYGTNQTGVIANRGNLSAGQDLTLSASNLDLQGQLLAVGDMTLEAQDTVQIRDSGTVPFMAAAGGQLLVQGNQSVDIFALNHADSGLFSGGDMVLRSSSTVLGDAHYWSGGSFRIEQLDGNLGGLESPNDPVIRTAGDVLIGSYWGTSLHIIAGGKVEIPNFILITGADPINGLQETVTLSDGTTITIDGRNEPTVDIRAGVEPAAIGIPFFSGTGNDSFFAPVDFPITPTNADITIGTIFNNGGKVFLTNQYQPNLLLDTPNGITVDSISVADDFGGGSVIIDSRNSITLNGAVNAFAFDVSSGNGGDVKLIAEGDITLNPGANIFSYGLLGGDITFNSKGDIFITDSLISSSNYTNVAGATGGEIQVTANSLFLTEGAQLFTRTVGIGNAGAVKITATDLVRFDGEDGNGAVSGIFSSVTSGAGANSGEIELTTASLELTNGAQVSASTSGMGDAGKVQITAADSVRLDGESSNGNSSGIFSRVNTQAEGNSGGIELTTSSLELTHGARVDASTLGFGDAGKVQITAADLVRLDGESSNGFVSAISSQVYPGAEGNSEGIELTTSSLKLLNGAQVSASTLGFGDAGKVQITAADLVRLDGESSNGFVSVISSQVYPGAEGNSGGIELTTSSLKLTDGAQVSASTFGFGDAGKVQITVADLVQLDGESSNGIVSAISSQVYPGAEGNSEGIELTTSSLELANGGRVNASTSGVGDAGLVKITATDSVQLDGENSYGNSSGIFSSVNSGAEGNSEGIELTTASLEVLNGAQVTASTFGVGDAGAVKITATDSVLSNGNSSGIFSSVEQGAEGNSEGIELMTASLELLNDAQVNASTLGIGNAGAVKITATNLVRLDGESNTGNISAISSQVNSGAQGNSGGIELITAFLKLTNGAIVDASTFGIGNAGAVKIRVTDSVHLDGESNTGNSSAISSQVTSGAEGNSGGVELKTATLELTNGGRVDASTSGVGDAGALKITATDSVQLDGESSNGFVSGIFSSLNAEAEGHSDGIELKTATLELLKGAQVSASTFGLGDAGAVKITATDSVQLDGESSNGILSGIFSSVNAGAEGNSDGIELTTASLELLNGARVNASTSGVGDAGKVQITATNSVQLDGESSNGNSSSISSRVNLGAEGDSEGLELTTATLKLTNGAVVSASTFGAGNAGKVQITATDSVRLDGESSNGSVSGILSQVDSEAEGNSGKIELTTSSLELNDGAQVSASTFGIGDAGKVQITATDLVRLDGEDSDGLGSGIFSSVNSGAEGHSGGIELTTSSLELNNGAELDASTFGIGNAGAVKITATDSVRLDGESSTGNTSAIFSAVAPEAKGTSGGIELTTSTLELTNGAQVTASTAGVGDAGKVQITATDSVHLNGELSYGIPSAISSTVAYGAKGNSGGIELTTSTLELANGAQVDTSTAGAGNAGLVKITATDSVRLYGESSDGIHSSISSLVAPETKGNSGGIELTTSSLELLNGAQVNNSTLGVGDVGAVKITATDSVHLDGESSNGFFSGVFSAVELGAEGNSGGIELTTSSLTLNNGAQVNASTAGIGNAGKVQITATDSVWLDGENSYGIPTNISSQVAYGAEGKSEGIELTTTTLELNGGAEVNASTAGVGNAGAVKITATDSVRLDGESSIGTPTAISSTVAYGAEGNSGGIELTAASLELLNGAQVNTSTGGIGNAGLMKINATDSVRLDGESSNGFFSGIFSFVNRGAQGNSEGIELTTSSLELTNGTQVNASTFGVGNAGLVKINATDSVRLDGESNTGNISAISSRVAYEAEGNSKGIELTTSTLELTNGAQVNASTSGFGNSGEVKITATDSVRLDGEDSNGSPSVIISRVLSGAEGNSEGIKLTTLSLELTNGAIVSTSTFGFGNAGLVKINATDSVRLDGESSIGFSSGILSQVNPGAKGDSRGIELTTASLELTNGGRVAASTRGRGDAGDISIRNAQSIFLGNNSSISTAVNRGSSGFGGDIDIQTGSLTLENNSRISARSQAPGDAGNINLNVSETLTATDSDITTSTTQSAGGQIDIIAKDIRLRGDSDITTSVFSGADNGGNITITTDSLIAFADSDILAFARDGRGGDITFLTPIFFGFAFRPAPRGTDPATLDLNNRVDINASGAVDGVITLPNLDFITNSLTELQDNFIDTDSILANSCIVRTEPQEATFTITGGGNLPLRPGDSSSSPYPTGVVRARPRNSPPRPWQKGDPIHQATGVYQLPDGRLVMARECG